MCDEISPERSELRQQSLEGCRIRDAGIRRRPKVEKVQRRMAKAGATSCELRVMSGGVGGRPSSYCGSAPSQAAKLRG